MGLASSVGSRTCAAATAGARLKLNKLGGLRSGVGEPAGPHLDARFRVMISPVGSVPSRTDDR